MEFDSLIPSELVQDARQHAGDNLRAIATYHEREYEIHYRREDIAGRYTDEQIQAMFDEFMMNGFAEPLLESLYQEKPRCQIDVLSEYIIFHFIVDEVSGYIVSVESGTFSNFYDFVEICAAHTNDT